MKNIFRISLLLISALPLFSCDTIWRNRGPRDADKRTLMEYRLEEMGLVDEKGDVITGNVPAAKEAEEPEELLPVPGPGRYSNEVEEYFSAQVFASKSSTEAKEFKESISSLFQDDVRLDYQAPYYRVCVGLARGYAEGQDLLKRVSSMGFPKAWLVKLRDER
jgi:hypothetical protein